MNDAPRARRGPARVSVIAAGFAGLAALLLLAAPLGAAAGVWDFGFGFTLMRWSVYAGGLAFLLGLAGTAVGFARRSRSTLTLSIAALALALVALGIPLREYRTARTVPPINDITTDLEAPPDFRAAGRGAENGAAGVSYPGGEFAEQQRAAYPDLRTLRFSRAPAEVFAAALEAARGMPGWEIVLADSAEGRIEATATTRWFRFRDDVVIRIRPDDKGAAVDLRSRSRIGASDVGANAERIRSFGRLLERRLGAEAGG